MRRGRRNYFRLITRVSRPGTRSVSRLLTVERYQYVMHLVSEVVGELAEGLDALHAYAASLNMGTLVGAPKIRAGELLRQNERTRRGPYGGAVGYLGYDSISYFEPRVPVMSADPQGLPESVFLFCDTLLIFDHLRHDIKVVSHVRLDGDVDQAYEEATGKIDSLVRRLEAPLNLPPGLEPGQPAGRVKPEAQSNFTRDDYFKVVEKCIEYIYAGDVIQVVNSQRFSRPTSAHPFQVYRSLRSINPSPYTEKRFKNIVYWNKLERGGHFAAFEQPETFIEELRNCFRTMR